MLSLFGFLWLFNTVGTVIGQPPTSRFSLGNTAYNLSSFSKDSDLEWKRNGESYVTLYFNNATNSCFAVKTEDYNSYCYKTGDEKEYVLELLNTTAHDGMVFTGDQEICVIVEPSRIEVIVNENRADQSYQVDAVAFSTKPEPTFKITITESEDNSTTDLFVKNKSICNNTFTNYHILHTFNSTTLKTMFPNLKGNTTFTVIVSLSYEGLDGVSFDNSTTFVYVSEVPECKECCRCHYNLIVLIITVVLVVVVIIVVIIHLCKIEEKKGVYWALNILLIIEIVVCVSLAIVQIVYLTDESDDSCQDTCQDSSKDTCQEEAGCKAATAFVVLGFIAAFLSVVVLILRLINRGLNVDKASDHKKETSDTEMKPGSEKEKNGTSDRTLPEPRRT